MKYLLKTKALLNKSKVHMRCLQDVRDLGLDDCWIAAGFIRNHIWNQLSISKTDIISHSDIDVIYFNLEKTNKTEDIKIEKNLKERFPRMRGWSVKNQARMHIHNNDRPYRNCADAMTHWPETATAIAAKLTYEGNIQIMAPFGLIDLHEFKLRPTPHFKKHKMELFEQRQRIKSWKKVWPTIRYE